MAELNLSVNLKPKNGRVLRVLCICRISGEKQDKLSLRDQEALLKLWTEQRYDGAVDYKVIAGVGSGEVLDRKEALRILEEVDTGKYDLAIAEDLGRIYRRLEALIFCETCLDVATRVVAINDHIDTANEEWRMLGFFAVMRHESYNVDTAKRIRRTLRNRFSAGGVVQALIPGFIKPPGTKNDSDVRKDPEFERVYQKWFDLLEGGASYSEVADWLNENNVPRRNNGKAGRWDCGAVTNITHNTLLKGVRQRNRKMSFRVHKTGHHKQKNAPPEDLLERKCPHLAFIEPERYDRILAMLKKKNACYRRKPVDGQDPRLNVSRKRTRWPGQHIYCGCCGAMFEYGAHGQNDHLICTGARKYECWMGISVDGPKAREKLCAVILEQLKLIPEFDSELLAAAKAEAELQAVAGQQRLKDLQRELQKVKGSLDRIAKTIEQYGPSETLMTSLKRLEGERETLLADQEEIQSRPQSQIQVPSADDVRERVGVALEAVASHDPVAMRLLHQLIPKIVVFPYRAIDGGIPVIRATFDLNLAAIDPRLGSLTAPGHPWHVTVNVNLYDPPKRRAIYAKVKQLQGEGLNRTQIAGLLEVTLPVVQQAINLRKKMDQLGTNDAYELLTAPPDDYTKMRRHLHKRFRQAPLEDKPAA